MRFTLSWLKDHLETHASLDEICERLTMLGLEVEGVTDRAAGLESFVVGHVISAEKHPDADKLRVCMVDNGSETFQVVCGAPNARAGMKGVFAPSGSYIPGTDLKLKKASIRGVESNGMLLSEREMGLSDAHDGIVDLPENAPIGASAVAVMGLGDPVIEVAITPNRGDCLGVRGIARDLAASGLGHLKAINTDPVPGAFKSPISVSIADAQACPQFVGRLMRGVTNGPSPKWLRQRLAAIGLRPISALVDITNYVTYDLGRPLHVFDADKVRGNITARLASAGEQMLALDGKQYELDGEMCVIADAAGPAALGGVMGGEASGCTEATRNVFIESALFDPVRTAATGRKLNILSDARFRFERSVDAAFAADGMEIATRLMLELCGGAPSEVVVAGAEPDWQREIPFRPARVAELAGVEISTTEMTRILTVLGFGVSGNGDAWQVAVPSWRADIVAEPCIVEEIVRVYGYENIPAQSLPRQSALPHPALDAGQRRRQRLRRRMAGRGLIEAVTYSFMPGKDASLFGGVDDCLRLSNPISSDLDVMRPSILPNLIAALGRNDARGFGDGALFEIGPQFAGDAAGDQELACSGVRSATAVARHWQGAARPVDVFDAKADVLAALDAMGVAADKVQVSPGAPSWYHPGRSATVRQGPKAVLAYFGEVHPGVLAQLDARGPLAAFEVHLGAIAPRKARGHQRPALNLSALQPVVRDFAFVVPATVASADITRAALAASKGSGPAAGGAAVTQVRVFDLFVGESIGAGHKSVAIEVTLQPADKTLTDAEIEAVSRQVVAAVAQATGGRLRD